MTFMLPASQKLLNASRINLRLERYTFANDTWNVVRIPPTTTVESKHFEKFRPKHLGKLCHCPAIFTIDLSSM